LKPILIDTSFIVALYNKSDRHHAKCLHVLDTMDRPAVTCEAVITESCFMLRQSPGAATDLLSTIENGTLEIHFQLGRSAALISALLEKYRDLPASFADACLVQMADQLDTGDVFTLDSDFKHYRWRRNRAFNMLIPLN
jgi:predicted nucleic acid-binding protein